MTPSAKAALSLVGVLLLIGSVLAVFVGLVLRQPYQASLLPIVLLIPLGILIAPKLWDRPILVAAGVLALIVVPWRTGEEGADLAHFTLPDFAAGALVGIVAVRTLVVGEQNRLRSWVLLPLTGVVVAGSVATLTASNPAMSVSGLIRYTEIFVVVPTATYLALQSQRDLKLLLTVVISLGVFEGAMGAYQFLTGTGASIGGSNIRAIGTFGAYDIMALAGIVSRAIIAAAAIFVGLRAGRRRWWALLLMLALLFPLAFSFSRGSWIATAVGVVVVVALDSWKKLVLFTLVGGLLGIVVVGVASNVGGVDGGSGATAANTITKRFTSISSSSSAPDQSVHDRYDMWQAALGIWADHPLTGVGLKNFSNIQSYTPLSFSGGSDIEDPSGGYRRVELLTPHNLYLLILAEQGLVGFFAYVVLFLSLGVAGFKRLRRMKQPSLQRTCSLFLIGVSTSALVGNLYADLGGNGTFFTAILLGPLIWLASGTELDEELHN